MYILSIIWIEHAPILCGESHDVDYFTIIIKIKIKIKNMKTSLTKRVTVVPLSLRLVML